MDQLFHKSDFDYEDEKDAPVHPQRKVIEMEQENTVNQDDEYLMQFVKKKTEEPVKKLHSYTESKLEI